jgi:hypothetical protein
MGKRTGNHSIKPAFIYTDGLAARTADFLPTLPSLIPLADPAFMAPDHMSRTYLVVLPEFRFTCRTVNGEHQGFIK